MRFKAGTLILLIFLAAIPSIARAQSPTTTIALGPNQIGLVKTTQGITTRITFPDVVRDIICGDLYDAATGKGGFVVQRIDNDVYLKPVISKGVSNLFVKTGEKGDHTYSFDLDVVSINQAYRMVNITNAPTLLLLNRNNLRTQMHRLMPLRRFEPHTATGRRDVEHCAPAG